MIEIGKKGGGPALRSSKPDEGEVGFETAWITKKRICENPLSLTSNSGLNLRGRIDFPYVLLVLSPFKAEAPKIGQKKREKKRIVTWELESSHGFQTFLVLFTASLFHFS